MSSSEDPKVVSEDPKVVSEDPKVVPAAEAATSGSGSSATSEYEIVTGAEAKPELSIVVGEGKEKDLEQNIEECLMSPTKEELPKSVVTSTVQEATSTVQDVTSIDKVTSTVQDVTSTAQDVTSTAQDVTSTEPQEDEADESGNTVFHNILYLGSNDIDDPKCEETIQAQTAEANRSGGGAMIAVLATISIPRASDGIVYVREAADASNIMHRFPVYQIIFFARGNADTEEASCFAFTTIVNAPNNERRFVTHIFKCEVAEAVTKVFVSFAQAFKRPAPELQGPVKVGEEESFKSQEAFRFEVTMEIKERENRGDRGYLYEVVPRQKGLFKLRSNIEKKVVITVRQISSNSCCLNVERCFGMLVSPGRAVRHADMQLLEHVTMATTASNNHGENSDNVIAYIINGEWDPRETAFAMLNTETTHEVHSVYMTIAADLVIQQVAEPVRFVIETKARIYPENEKYWYYQKRNLTKQYQVRLKRSETQPNPDHVTFDLCGIDVSEEMDTVDKPSSLTSHLANLTFSTLGSLTRTNPSDMPMEPMSPMDEDDDGEEEPILSGFGSLSKDCSGTELEQWSLLLKEWDDANPLVKPKQLPILVRRGIPEALRGEVWQRITGASVQMDEIIDTYRVLVTKESPDDKVILRDIHRTFPAHEFFKDAGGGGQEALYRIAKAYSVYDSEIGYCQGQSFLIAALLLQMPEEQAFGVLVKVMHNLGLRDMFRENFEQLQLRLYQLDRLIENLFPDIWQHFTEHGIESHMYASQWFLTVFTAKFPLFLVFRVMDVFLMSGFDSIFQVALGILKVSRKDLLTLDFEGLMKYFRVNIPKRYRSEDHAKYLMEIAMGIKLKRLHKYEKEWANIRAAERAREDPVVRLERENKKLLSDNMRLDTENDNLARQLVTSKIEMRKDIDAAEDARDIFEKDLSAAKGLLEEANEEKKRLQGENEMLKALMKKEVDRLDSELAAKANVVAEYKRVVKQLSQKVEAAERRARVAEGGQATPPKEEGSSAPSSGPSSLPDDETGAMPSLGLANARIRELELELAQTKLALVETECKNQDLTHQFNTAAASSTTTSSGTKTWLSKTLSSIKESATSAAGSAATTEQGKEQTTMKKSTSVDVIHYRGTPSSSS